MLRNIRIGSQIAFFIFFLVIFFIFNKFPHPYASPADLFLRLNPLVALLTEVAARAFIPSVFVLGLIFALGTVVFGRFFCGFICPLGTSIDAVDTYVFKKSRTSQRKPPQFLQRTKYVILIGLVVLALFGSIFPLFMDPISLFTRIFALIVNPILSFIGMKTIATGGPVFGALGLEKLRLLTVKTPLYYGVSFMVLFTALIFAGSFWDRRFWCQYLCPSGALFGLLSRFAIFRRRTSQSGCNSCGACARVCPVRAIDNKQIDRTNTAECIDCGLCTQIKTSCSGFQFSAPTPATIAPPDLHRRHVLIGIGGGALLAPAFAASAINKADGRGRLIRPPGAIPEPEFLSRCIACGNCMKSCPTNALQPSTFTDGFNRLYTPKLVPRIGFCDSKCHTCGYSCPTGALRSLEIDEKYWAKIGTAIIDRHRCLAWSQNKECLVCDEVCPYNAIEPMVVQTTKGPFKVPVVWEDLCTGCGTCENACPIFDEAAIVIVKFGENRKLTGPYLTPGQKKRIVDKRTNSDSEHSSGAGGLSESQSNSSPFDLSTPPPEQTPEPKEKGVKKGSEPGNKKGQEKKATEKKVPEKKPSVPSGGFSD
jgi:MauM/NapG family ferredoxin protein